MNICKPQRRRFIFPLIVQEQDDSNNRPPLKATEPVVQDLLLVTTDVSSIVNTKLPRVRIRRRGTFPRLDTNMRLLNDNGAILHHSRSSPSLDREVEDSVTTTASSTIGAVPLSLELPIDAILLGSNEKTLKISTSSIHEGSKMIYSLTDVFEI